ncbi:MAG: hypothetical protein V3S55_10055 [Nitrospiraceae bacterium]
MRSQILVLEGGDPSPLLINPEDEVTGEDGVVIRYPDCIMATLTKPDGWLDVWQDGSTPEGERTRLARRVFSRNVINLIRCYIFPLEENMVQS